MKGRGIARLDRGGFEIGIYSDHPKQFEQIYTFEIKKTLVGPEDRFKELPTTIFSWSEEPILKAFGEALVELGIMKDHGTDQELKATKFHLEDMRDLTKKLIEKAVK